MADRSPLERPEIRAEVAALSAPDPRLGLPMPAYGGRSLPNVTASVVQALVRDPSDGAPLAPPLEPPLDPFHGRPAEGPVVVLLVDGFGWSSFQAWVAGNSGTSSVRWGALAHPITTVFPTTTVSALVSLSAGTAPAGHGVVGYRQYLPRFGVVADILRMCPAGVGPPESLVGPDWTPGLISAAPPIFRRGVRGVALSRDKFQGTGFTRMLYEGAEYVPYVTASDMAHLLAEVIDRPDPPPLIYTYWDELDTVHHLRGPHPALFDFEADRVAHLLEHVAAHVAPARARTTTVVVVADHGQVPVDPARQVRIDQLPDVTAEMARPLAGDRRAGYFAGRPGREPMLRQALERHLPPGTRIVPVADAVETGLFGPPPHHPELAARLGDLIAFAPVPSGFVSVPPGGRPPARELRGGHGGLTAEELLVPLIAGRLEEFVADASPGTRRRRAA